MSPEKMKTCLVVDAHLAKAIVDERLPEEHAAPPVRFEEQKLRIIEIGELVGFAKKKHNLKEHSRGGSIKRTQELIML